MPGSLSPRGTKPSGRSLDPVGNGGAREMVTAPGKAGGRPSGCKPLSLGAQNPAYRPPPFHSFSGGYAPNVGLCPLTEGGVSPTMRVWTGSMPTSMTSRSVTWPPPPGPATARSSGATGPGWTGRSRPRRAPGHSWQRSGRGDTGLNLSACIMLPCALSSASLVPPSKLS